MRRIIRLWHRRQRAITTTPATPRVEDIATQPVTTPAPAPPVVDWSGYDIDAAVDAIVANHIPALPRRVQRQIPRIAREATGNGASFRLFTARYLPLMLGMDAEAIAEWHPTAQMMLRSACVVMRPELRARLATVGNADASLTIYAPRDWLTNVPLRPVIEQHLVAAVSSATGVPIRDLVRATWEESDGPYLWSVELWDSANWQEVA